MSGLSEFNNMDESMFRTSSHPQPTSLYYNEAENAEIIYHHIEATSSSTIPQPSTTTLTSALEAWKQFDLDSRRSELDQAAHQIAEQQNVSATQRKMLADQTKETKRKVSADTTLSPPDVSQQFVQLLKQYQKEIDRLTNRAKTCEGSFLKLYQALYDIPDPSNDLMVLAQQRMEQQHSHDYIRELEQTCWQRTRELDEYKTNMEREVATLKAETEALNSTLELRVKEAVNKMEANLLSEEQNLTAAYEMREQELLHQLSLANEQLRAQKSSAGRNGSPASNESAEVQDQIQALKTQNSSLKAELEAVKKANRAALTTSGYDNNDHSRGSNSIYNSSSYEISLAHSEEVLQLQEQLHEKSAYIRVLEAEKSTMVDRAVFDKLCLEYETLKLATSEAKRLGQLVKSTEGIGSEERLVAKIKSLEAVLSEMRVSLTKKERECMETATKLSHLQDRLSIMSSKQSSEAEEGAKSDGETNTMWDTNPTPSARVYYRTAEEQQIASMLDLISSQRDRLRSRVIELERDNGSLLGRIESQLSEIRGLKNENVELYEYIQQLKKQTSSKGTNTPTDVNQSITQGGRASDINADDHAATLSKYEKSYNQMKQTESMVQKRDQYRKIGSMNRVERLSYRAGQELLKHSWIRIAVFSYFIVVHIFVYIALTVSTHSANRQI